MQQKHPVHARPQTHHSGLFRLTSRLAPDRSARSRLEQHRLACMRLHRLRLAILKLMYRRSRRDRSAPLKLRPWTPQKRTLQHKRTNITGGESFTVPDSGAPTLWAWPEETVLTLYGKWGSDPLEAASSVHNIYQVRHDTFEGIVNARPAVNAPLSPIPAAQRVAPSQRNEPPREHLEVRLAPRRWFTDPRRAKNSTTPTS